MNYTDFGFVMHNKPNSDGRGNVLSMHKMELFYLFSNELYSPCHYACGLCNGVGFPQEASTMSLSSPTPHLGEELYT